METIAARSALVVGATGLVGRHVVDRLAKSADYARVVVVARRSAGAPRPKVEERIVDFDALAELERLERLERVDDVYACLGTTIKKAGTQAAFRKVDHDYTVRIAELARRSGATRFALVSSVGASATSANFYLRTKGETERDVEALAFETLVIARPSFLVGERDERRRGERAFGAVARSVSFAMVSRLKKYRPIEAEHVAAALVSALLHRGKGKHVLEYEELVDLSR